MYEMWMGLFFEGVAGGRETYYITEGVKGKQILSGICKFAIAMSVVEVDHAVVFVTPHYREIAVIYTSLIPNG